MSKQSTMKNSSEDILEYIKGKPGPTAIKISRELNLKLYKVWRELKVLREQNKVYRFADWYGVNSGYTFRYTTNIGDIVNINRED